MTFTDAPTLFGDPEPTVRTVRVREHDRRVSDDYHPGPLARNSDPETSHQARPRDPDATERLILATFTDRGPMTDDEMCRALPTRYAGTLKTARSRLARAGYLHDSGDRRPSARNRLQIVWEVPVNPDNDTVEVYRAKDGWRWHRVDMANGKILSDSGQAYADRGDCMEAAEAYNPGIDVNLEPS